MDQFMLASFKIIGLMDKEVWNLMINIMWEILRMVQCKETDYGKIKMAKNI